MQNKMNPFQSIQTSKLFQSRTFGIGKLVKELSFTPFLNRETIKKLSYAIFLFREGIGKLFFTPFLFRETITELFYGTFLNRKTNRELFLSHFLNNKLNYSLKDSFKNIKQASLRWRNSPSRLGGNRSNLSVSGHFMATENCKLLKIKSVVSAL